jgi:formamidopyrimidine-DNA glycosylase
MPELPEVETTRRMLEPHLLGRVVRDVLHTDPARYKNTTAMLGKEILRLERRGKYLIFRLDDGLDCLVHLKMTGGFRIPPDKKFLEPPRFERLRLELHDGEVSYVDSRRFGFWEVIPTNQWQHIKALSQMGPEPLEPSFVLKDFQVAMAKVSRVKPALLSQKPVAGVGNIYADESLWLAKIHPEASRLSSAAAKRLHSAIIEVMTRAVAVGGSTLSDNSYQQPSGESGYFQLEHHAYDRTGQPCSRCGAGIEKYTLAGRGTHYCPDCQPKEQVKRLKG